MLNKLGGCVVVFNPKDDVYDNILKYIDLLDCLVVVDNSTEENEIIEKLIGNQKIIYINNHGNLGIAAALNKGLRYLCGEGFDIVLTMDQDSQFPQGEGNEILEIVDDLIDKYGIVGLNFNQKSKTKSRDVVELDFWLTSGNFVNLKAYREVNGFHDDLFIDYVDIDFDYRLSQAGYKICYLKDYSLIHSIGNPIKINFFGHTFYAMNHRAFRYYYRYRNSRYLYGVNKGKFKKLYFKELFVNIPKMLFFENDKINKLKMINRGISDGKNNKLGVLSE